MQNKSAAQLIKELDLQGIIESVGDGISIQDTNFKILYQNNVHKNFIGNHAGEYCYKAYEKRDDICEGCPLDLAFKDNMIHKAERSASIKQRVSYFEITASVLRDLTGKAMAGIEIVREITESKKVEEALKESKERLVEAQQIAHIGSWDWDVIKNEENWSQETYQIFGVNPKNFAPNYESFMNAIHPDDRESVAKAVEAGLEKDKPVDIDYRIRRPDGTERVANSQGKVFRDKKGNPIRVAGTVQDITERKKAEETLQRAHDELELRVKERTLELQEKNIAMKVLLKQREEDKNEVEQNILRNVKSLVQPYITKLKRNNANLEDITYLNIIESNLEDIISPFSQKLSSKYMSFTSKEIEIANLIKEGKKDKEIMEVMNIAFDTVKAHRKNIRKKLGIHGKGTNLRNKLLSI